MLIFEECEERQGYVDLVFKFMEVGLQEFSEGIESQDYNEKIEES